MSATDFNALMFGSFTASMAKSICRSAPFTRSDNSASMRSRPPPTLRHCSESRGTPAPSSIGNIRYCDSAPGRDRLVGEGAAAQLDELAHRDAVLAEEAALIGDVKIDVVDRRRRRAGRELDGGRLGA